MEIKCNRACEHELLHDYALRLKSTFLKKILDPLHSKTFQNRLVLVSEGKQHCGNFLNKLHFFLGFEPITNLRNISIEKTIQKSNS